MEGRVLTCVYCGREYPQETPAWGDTGNEASARKDETNG